jgi:hypothetical protein
MNNFQRIFSSNFALFEKYLISSQVSLRQDLFNCQIHPTPCRINILSNKAIMGPSNATILLLHFRKEKELLR